MKTQKAGRSAKGCRFGIVAAKFNQRVTGKLLAACLDTLEAHGAATEDVAVVRVPGAFEIPLVARAMAKSGRYDAVISLGAVIRGDTPHFEYISAEVSRGIGQAALDTDVPIIFGVLTTETVAQAVERADTNQFNRGGEAAKSAIEMVRVMRMLKGEV
jgi:6,7-dimethyl-8-ribityllumazine synthase